MSKIRSFLFLVLGVILSVASVSLFSNTTAVPPQPGTVVSIHPGTTAYGIKMALEGAPGTQLFVKDNLVILTWSVRDQGMAFGLLDMSTLKAVSDKSIIMRLINYKGNLINCADSEAMIKSWMDHGWKIITASELAKAMSGVTASVSAQYYNIASGMTTMMFLPAGVLYDNDMLEFMHEKVIQ